MRPIQNGGGAPNENGQHRQSAESRQRVERARLRERRRRRRRNITLLVCLLLILVIAACAVVAIWFISDPSGTDKPAETTAVTTDTQSGTESTTAAETDPLTGPEAYGITFISDLADYEQYMDPAERDDYLILVNKTSTVSASDEPADLVDIADTRQDGRATQQMRLYAAKALEALFIEMRAYGYTDVSERVPRLQLSGAAFHGLRVKGAQEPSGLDAGTGRSGGRDLFRAPRHERASDGTLL